MKLFFDIAFTIITAVLSFCCSYKIFQIYQLSNYKTKGVLAWFKNTKFDYLVRYFALAFLSFIGMTVFVACFSTFGNVKYLGSLFLIIFSVIFIVITIKEQKKTPLKFTPRVMRSAGLSLLIFGALSYLFIYLSSLTSLEYALSAILLFFVPFVVMLAQIIMQPFEKFNNNRFKKQAVKKLESVPNLIKIGITGSFGKTTAKNILAKMLEQKYKVAYSPSSYNTPMGLCRYINNSLSSEAEVFIAEMGARQSGDIDELAKMIKPSYALITSVGKQHLETFGSLENIVKTKYELIENLLPNGVAVFNGGNEEVKSMFDKCSVNKYLCGEKDGASGAYYSNVSLSGKGTSFDLTIGERTEKVNTIMLGNHIAGLITACAQVAYVLGVTTEQIVRAISSLKPVPHRLELIDRGETVIIDDAYNSNPEGAKNALQILGCMEGVKVVITPGLVEMGQEQEAANTELGETIAKTVDYAYLVGNNAKFLKAGAVKGGMNNEKIFIFETLNEAVEKLADITGKKAVLFENDLPDNL